MQIHIKALKKYLKYIIAHLSAGFKFIKKSLHNSVFRILISYTNWLNINFNFCFTVHLKYNVNLTNHKTYLV